VGIALKPNTKVETVVEYVEEADMVLIMTVEPGKFKLKELVLSELSSFHISEAQISIV
jgi:pentose-5-phosphate-3-epimerase